MNKIYIFSIVCLFVFLTGCNASKKASFTVSTQQKLEIQYTKYKGVQYQFGGADRRGFDCSGFTQKVYYNAFQIKLPRTTEEMSQIGKKVSKNNLLPGDLVFFKPSRKYNHVGIYMGSDLFIHSSTSQGVIKSELSNVYWKKKYKNAKRILNIK